jgi:hypothetical protein
MRRAARRAAGRIRLAMLTIASLLLSVAVGHGLGLMHRAVLLLVQLALSIAVAVEATTAVEALVVHDPGCLRCRSRQ